ncbi:NADPH-dependent oxidoreductase [Crenobacter sp. SG2305]|uniref:NADPH-dependent oxidoreductase n=1 Tax=Crenobacter oryzisoli TaxID=3056844 RepID=UPI0025AA9F80|nr:NADPH-dependent oxidoreductase [Crenobacter sp. SG2305]MDN0082981.1 NADPH-dependent oxidoreductase [Crenobacter sp. SG2305]
MNASLSTTLHGTLSQHASTRAYRDAAIPTPVLDRIIEAGWRGPTSINGQQVSLVVVQDSTRRAEIAKIAGGQPWIAQAPVFITVVMDFSKTALGVEVAGKQQVIHDSIEGTMVGAVDAGITLGRLMAAAQAEGLGVVPIGGIRRDPQAMIKLLNLPPLTFPLVGLALGYPATAAPRKPRLPLSTFRHDERYQAEGIAEAITDYDRELLDYWQSIGRTDGLPWSQNIAQYYQSVYFPEVAPAMRAQGFSFER